MATDFGPHDGGPFAGMDLGQLDERLLAQAGISRAELEAARHAAPAREYGAGHQAAPAVEAP